MSICWIYHSSKVFKIIFLPTTPFCSEGNTPLDLLSTSLANGLDYSKRNLSSSTVLSFGKADFTLGVQLPKTGVDVLRPRRIEQLEYETIEQIAASKFHSLALTKSGVCYTWGHGKGGRLGHGDEATQPDPIPILNLTKHRIRVVATSENHSLAVTTSGDLFSWGSNRFGQLGHGDSGLGANSTPSCILSPKLVAGLQKVDVVGIAVGDFHSVCYTTEYEVKYLSLLVLLSCY